MSPLLAAARGQTQTAAHLQLHPSVAAVYACVSTFAVGCQLTNASAGTVNTIGIRRGFNNEK